MTGKLESVVQEMMTAYDHRDAAKIVAMLTEDAQGVDDLSRKWMRGNGAMNDYFRQFGPMLTDIRTDLGDVSETIWGDAGLVTLWMEQDYKVNGEQQHFSGPMSVGLRREHGEWRVALIHAVPMPPAEE